MKRIDDICPIRQHKPDDLFITCASFEERFLGATHMLKGNLPNKLILFRFKEQNNMRENIIQRMEKDLNLDSHMDIYHQVPVEHGRSIESIISFHDFLNKTKLFSRELCITVDISTFTKDLLLNLLFYMNNLLPVTKLRLLYTIPGRYASPEEGWLSSGIQNVHISPMCWNGWSPIKDNLLIIILGFEEMRAWSLMDRFSADQEWLFITSPGSLPEWDSYCEEFNTRLLREKQVRDKIPAMGAMETHEVLTRHITKEISNKYNIFISPLGTKPQIIGIINFCLVTPNIPVNLITTTVVAHNVPYYSWGIGDTYESYFSIGRSSNGKN